MSKLSWNTSLEFADLFNDFFNNYYKEAALALKEYYNAVQAHYVTLYDKYDTDGCGGFFQVKHDYSVSGDWDYPVLRSFKLILRKGYEAIANSDRSPEEKEKLRRRVLLEDVCIDAMIRESYPLFIEDYNAFETEFRENCAILGIRTKTEGGNTL